MSDFDFHVIGSRDETTWLDADPTDWAKHPLDTLTTNAFCATRFDSYDSAARKLRKLQDATAQSKVHSQIILKSFLDNAEIFRVECAVFRTT